MLARIPIRQICRCMSTDMWLTAAFLLIYLIVVLPLSIVAASKVKALLSHRL